MADLDKREGGRKFGQRDVGARKHRQVHGVTPGTQHAGLDHRKHEGGLVGEGSGPLTEDGANIRLQSLHFLPHVRGKAFEQGSERITTRPWKMTWSRKESVGR